MISSPLPTIFGRDSTSQIESITRELLSFTASCYAVGIIVVNLHFAQYGFYSLSLLRLNYVMAGFWPILVLIVFYSLSTVLLGRLTDIFQVQQSITRRSIRIVFEFIVAIGIVVMIAQIANLLEIRTKLSWLGILIPGVMGIIIYSRISKDLFHNPTGKIDKLEALLNVTVGIALLTVFIIGFSQVMYNKIPASLGGGRPQPIQFTVAIEEKYKLAHSGISFIDLSSQQGTQQLAISDTLQLVLLNEKDLFFFSTATKGSVVISRDLVIALHFLK